jgi:hypothetical protein
MGVINSRRVPAAERTNQLNITPVSFRGKLLRVSKRDLTYTIDLRNKSVKERLLKRYKRHFVEPLAQFFWNLDKDDLTLSIPFPVAADQAVEASGSNIVFRDAPVGKKFKNWELTKDGWVPIYT